MNQLKEAEKKANQLVQDARKGMSEYYFLVFESINQLEVGFGLLDH